MKRLLLASLLLALCVGTSAHGELSGRLDSLRNFSMRQSDIPTTGTDKVDTLKVGTAVNIAVHKVCTDFPALIVIDTLSIDSVTGYDTLPSRFVSLFRADQLLTVDEYGNSTQGLRPLTEYADNNVQDKKAPTADQAIQETDYPYLDGYRVLGQTFQPSPRWNRGDTVKVQVQYYAIDTSLTANSSTTRVLPRYREYVTYWTSYLIEKMQGNTSGAMIWYQMYEAARLRNGFPDPDYVPRRSLGGDGAATGSMVGQP